jgi:hypothetical protein
MTYQTSTFKELMGLWTNRQNEVSVVGVAGKHPIPVHGTDGAPLDDFGDPYAWIEYTGRPEIAPKPLMAAVSLAYIVIVKLGIHGRVL